SPQKTQKRCSRNPRQKPSANEKQARQRNRARAGCTGHSKPAWHARAVEWLRAHASRQPLASPEAAPDPATRVLLERPPLAEEAGPAAEHSPQGLRERRDSCSRKPLGLRARGGRKSKRDLAAGRVDVNGPRRESAVGCRAGHPE